MEYPAKMMSQHFNSMLEHLKVSSLINKTKNNQGSSSSSTNNSHEKEINSIDHTDNSSVTSSSPILNNRPNVIIQNNTSACEKMHQQPHNTMSNNPIGISVNSNNQIQSNGTNKIQEEKCNNINNDISNSTREVTNNFNSCEKSNSSNVLCVGNKTSKTSSGSSSLNFINIGSGGCPIMGSQQQRKQSFVIKPIKLKNIITQAETYDTLYTRATEVSYEKNLIRRHSFTTS